MKLVHGIGINDADYPVTKYQIVDGKRCQVWICKFYLTWRSMFERCYSHSWLSKYPTYVGCSVFPEWHYFMTFRAWMEKQDWEGKELDKDLLFPYNKVYAPKTCVFVDKRVNLFINENKNVNKDYPTGVSFIKETGKFKSRCSTVSGERKYLGTYDTATEAHQAWLTEKLKQAKVMAEKQLDQRVAKALIDRYENYGECK